VSAIEQTKAGPVLRVRVRPRAPADEVTRIDDTAVRVSVRAAPERGKANAAVIKVLARRLGVPAGTLTLLSGGSARDKRILVTGLTLEQLLAAFDTPG